MDNPQEIKREKVRVVPIKYILNSQKIVTTEPKGVENRRKHEKKSKKSLFFEKRT